MKDGLVELALGERADVGARREHLVEPAITMQRTSGSASNASTASASASMTSGESALRASGRLSLHSATWSVTLVSRSEPMARQVRSPQIGRFAASQVAEGRRLRPATCHLRPHRH